MISINNIIDVIDAILFEVEVNKSPSRPLCIYTSEFCSHISRDQVKKILSKLEAEKFIYNINVSDTLAEWRYAIANVDTNHSVSLRVDQLKLNEYKNNLKKKQEPASLKIGIEEIPRLEINGLEERVVLQKQKNKKIWLPKFPSKLRWEEISVRFLNEHEIIIKARDETHQTTYEAMGFQDEKTKLPNSQWAFLRGLAIKSGELSWQNNADIHLKKINAIKKQKQLLSEALRAYFQIDEDPFYSYRKEGSYKIKISLIPELDDLKNNNQQDFTTERSDLGVREYLNEHSPLI